MTVSITVFHTVVVKVGNNDVRTEIIIRWTCSNTSLLNSLSIHGIDSKISISGITYTVQTYMYPSRDNSNKILLKPDPQKYVSCSAFKKSQDQILAHRLS
jgi:hypothetical protein